MWYGTLAEAIEAISDGSLPGELERIAENSQVSVTTSQIRVWDESLPTLLKVFGMLDERLFVAFEHQLPGTSARPDVILLGEHESGARHAVVIEQKLWDRVDPGVADCVRLGSRDKLHPSSQAQGYVEYMKNLDGAFVDREPASKLSGCAHLPGLRNITSLLQGLDPDATAINQALMNDCPAFGRDDDNAFVLYLKDRLPGPPSEAFIKAFLARDRRPSQQLAMRVGLIKGKESRPWRLIGRQDEVYRTTIVPALEAVRSGQMGTNDRQVMIVTGGPGTGKTILALHTMLDANTFSSTCFGGLNAALVSTSQAQHQSLLGDLQLADSGRVLPSGRLTSLPVRRPGDLRVRSERWTGRKSAPDHLKDPEVWAKYCAGWRDDEALQKAWTDKPEFDVLVVDEAHALVDPSKPRVNGSQSLTWRLPWGPQVWHLVASARLTILFMDADQGYRQVESTLPEDIETLFQREGLHVVRKDLGGSQFRLNGGAEFVAWLDGILGLGKVPPPPPETSKLALRALFSVEDSAGCLRDRLKSLHDGGEPARLLAGYAWPWASKDSKNQDNIDSDAESHPGIGAPISDLTFRWAPWGPDGQRDFNLGTGLFSDSSKLFGQGRDYPATAGYPLTVRGRDFDHVGVLFGPDLVHRSDGWRVDPRFTTGSDFPSLAAATRDESKNNTLGPAGRELTRRLTLAYRILLTRGNKSVRAWFSDSETRDFVRLSWERWLDGI